MPTSLRFVSVVIFLCPFFCMLIIKKPHIYRSDRSKVNLITTIIYPYSVSRQNISFKFSDLIIMTRTSRIIMFIMSDILLSKKFLKTLCIYVTAVQRKSQVNFHNFFYIFVCFFVKTNKSLLLSLFRSPSYCRIL